jgi:hypothetical protein
MIAEALYLANLCRLGAFSTFSGFVFNASGVVKCPVALPVDVRMMDEEIVTAIVGGDESVSLLIVKPLYSTCCHVFLLLRFEVEACSCPLSIHRASPEGWKTCPTTGLV